MFTLMDMDNKGYVDLYDYFYQAAMTETDSIFSRWNERRMNQALDLDDAEAELSDIDDDYTPPPCLVQRYWLAGGDDAEGASSLTPEVRVTRPIKHADNKWAVSLLVKGGQGEKEKKGGKKPKGVS